MKKMILVALLVALPLIASGCVQQQETIRLGSVLTLTGDAASYGIAAKEGIELAADEINSVGGVNGKRIEVVFEDGKCNGRDAATAAQKLVSVDKVNVIFGTSCSSELLSMAPITEQNKVIVISSSASNPQITDAGEYIFRNYPSDAVGGKVVADAIAGAGRRKVALISENTDYAQGLRSVVKARLGEKGVEVAGDEIFEQGSRDMRAQLLKISSASPDALFLNGQSGITTGIAARQARELGMNATFYIIFMATVPDFNEAAGDAAAGTISVEPPVLDAGNEKAAGFLRNFRSKFGKNPASEFVSAAQYDTVYIIADAMRACGPDTDCMKDYIYNTSEFSGAIGNYRFDANGDIDGVDLLVITISRPVAAAKFGATLPLTGDAANYGLGAQKAVQMAAEEISKKGEIKLDIIFEDDQCDGKKSVTTVQKLISTDNAAAVIGPFCSAATLPAAPLAEDWKTVLFSGSASNAKITDAGDYVFRIFPSDSLQGRFAAEYAYNELGARKVVVEYANEEYSVGLKAVFEARFRELGGEISLSQAHERGATDLRSQITKIKAAGPDMVYILAFPGDAVNFLKQAKELQLDKTLLSGEAMEDPQIVEGAQGAAEGLIFTRPKDSVSQEFVEAYKARFGEAPIAFAEYYYDIVYILADAAKACGPDRACIKDELYKVSNYQGASGLITIDSNGDLAEAHYMVKTVMNGEFVEYKP